MSSSAFPGSECSKILDPAGEQRFGFKCCVLGPTLALDDYNENATWLKPVLFGVIYIVTVLLHTGTGGNESDSA